MRSESKVRGKVIIYTNRHLCGRLGEGPVWRFLSTVLLRQAHEITGLKQVTLEISAEREAVGVIEISLMVPYEIDVWDSSHREAWAEAVRHLPRQLLQIFFIRGDEKSLALKQTESFTPVVIKPSVITDSCLQ